MEKYKDSGLEFIKIKNNVGLEVTFCTLGASIFEIEFLGEKMTNNPKNPQDFLRKNVYHGKTIGRVAGRIKGNKLTLNNTEYTLANNEGENVLHGGNGAISERVFDLKVKSESDFTELLFSYLSKDGEAGFPGDALFEIRYTIPNDKAEIKVQLSCKVNKDCPISLTNHSYFCLGDPNINNLSLQMNVSKLVLINDKDLSIEGCAEVPSYLDFRKLKPIIKDIDAKEINTGTLCGYDHILLVDNNNPKALLENDRFRLSISTDLDAIVLYTDNYEDRKSVV